jgi:S-layer protein (TIGR01567 family)
MSNNISSGANAPVKRVVLTIIVILFMAGSAYAETILWDESQGSPLPFTWNSTNFVGFNVEGVGTEDLTVWQTDLNSAQRTIAAGNLTYSTRPKAKKLNVVIALNLTSNQEMTDKGLDQASPGSPFDNGEYYILNWQAERYVAINGKAHKLSRLVMDQGVSEKNTMLIGETWDIGDGWVLLVNSIDAKAFPRQVWISLYKDGIKKDDKVVTVGGETSKPIYTYVEQSISGESDVPLFVTYVESIFAGTTSDVVQFGGAWALSTDVNVIQSGDTYGMFRVAMVSFRTLTLMNSETPVTLSPSSTINLIGNIKFKVINDTAYLKFYPSDEPGLNISASSSNIQVGTPVNVIFTVTSGDSPVEGAQVSLIGAANASGITDITGQVNIPITAAYAGNITAGAERSGYTGGTTTLRTYLLPAQALDSWALEENYILNLIDIDPRNFPKQARLQLSKDGILVKDSFVAQDEMIEYCPSNCLFNATVDVIFNGTQGIAVSIANASQYSEINGTPVMTDAVHMFRSGDFTGISWLLDEGYDLKMMDIDYRSYPRLVWFELFKNGTVMDDAFLSTDERYTYISPSNSTILTSVVDVIFKGDANSLVKLTEVYKYSETSGGMLLDCATHSYISGEITRTDLPLYEDYNLSVIGIDVYGYPRMAWLQLYKNDTMVHDKIIDIGDIYIYENSSGIILYAQNSAIFSGRPLSAVQFRNFTQYSEIDNGELISNATYTISLYGTPVPVPIPSATQPSGYGTLEVRGISASGAFKWTPQNFAGFYYDINSNTGTEELNILQPDIAATRMIGNGNLTYSTTAHPKMLNVVKYAFSGNVWAAEDSGLVGFDNGNYYIMGWQGERYTALKGRVDKLAEIVLEQGTAAADKKTLVMGESWDIGSNWTLTVQSVDVKAYPRQAWLTLGRDGVKLEDVFVFQHGIYTHVENNFSNETGVPLFMTYLDSVFAGATTDMVQLRYTWALNTSVSEIMHNETYGIFTDAEVSPDKTLKFKNSNTDISLSRGSTIDLIGPLRFQVADNDSLRFMPVAEHRQVGTGDIRGAVWNEAPIEEFGGIGSGGVWNASNFAGFFYDIDNDLGTEELNVLQTDLHNYQRTIYQNNLIYTTSAQPKMLNLVKYAFGGNVSSAAAAGLDMTMPGQAFEGGIYQIIGWQGEKHVAVNGMVNILGDLILDQGAFATEKKTMFPNETWNVGGGWSLTLDFVNAKSSPRIAGITLRKDGEFMDSRMLTSGPYGANSVYTYADISTTIPLFVAYVDSIFSGMNYDMAQFRYTWAVSPEVTSVNSGVRFGVFNVTEVDTTARRIGLRNIDTTVTLSQYSGTVDLMGELKFRVANNDSALRFSPIKRVTTPYDTTLPGYINGTVLSNGTAVVGSIVSTNAGIKAITNASGAYSFLVPAGTYYLTATSEPIYYPNSSIIVNAMSGMTVVKDIELDMKPTGTITGNVKKGQE